MPFHWHGGFVARRGFSLRLHGLGRVRRDNSAGARALVGGNVVQVIGDVEHAALVDPAVVFGAMRLPGEREVQEQGGAICDDKLHEYRSRQYHNYGRDYT